MIKERKDTLAKQQAEEKLIADTWDSLAGQGLADELRKEQLAKQRRAEEKLIADTWDSLAGQGLADELRKEQLAKQRRVCSIT
ncbi:hypothetical protein PYW07_010422 [Mythimna separata]|uniref:Uncharacterized protein n=1 Tax=Mythimna separata TaxID=271217 RepID=A0AAD7Y9S9_MYTSE|nr:hypothetical protein PYW07_010421 [Mythimna separata]KAJ8708297.1 hypothetical protein PYW07_010422 [Mythimna separata]